MDMPNQDADLAIRNRLDRFFSDHPSTAIQIRATKVLRLLAAKGKPLAGKTGGWAGGIVYAVSSIGVGVPGVLNRELEAAFGVRMSEIYRRAAMVRELLGADLPSSLEELPLPDTFTLRDEANAICAYAFRNGPIEAIHGDGRISDPEMTHLMINASEHLAKLLAMKRDTPAEYDQFIRAYHRQWCTQWER